MKTIEIVTSARSDLGFYLPLMCGIEAHPELELKIVATGTHLSSRFGLTVRHIEEAGFQVHERVNSLVEGGSPEDLGRSIGRGVIGFSCLFARHRPDILVVLGDRFDMFPAALAALPFRIPVAHIAGGEVTEGTIDDALRHSLTKLSHLHFVAMEEYGRRVIQMGEEPWRVIVSGSLSLDNLRTLELWSPEETARHFGLDSSRPIAIVTYHPVTLEYDGTKQQISNLLTALGKYALQCVFTYPNSDTSWPVIASAIERYCEERSGCRTVVNAGQIGYYSLMKAASVMLGNSSSGIVEAPSFRLPVVNVGTRQKGRVRAANVIDCGYGDEEISRSLGKALSEKFRKELGTLQNPYGDGRAAERIIQRLAALDGLPDLLRKKFTCYAQP